MDNLTAASIIDQAMSIIYDESVEGDETYAVFEELANVREWILNTKPVEKDINYG